jgi:hypothetical protein
MGKKLLLELAGKGIADLTGEDGSRKVKLSYWDDDKRLWVAFHNQDVNNEQCEKVIDSLQGTYSFIAPPTDRFKKLMEVLK